MTDSEQTHITWRKSTASNASSCVEVAFADESVLVRNSRDPLGPILSFSREEWMAFLEGAHNGEFTLDQARTIHSDTPIIRVSEHR
jgi:Domain of unknown function (DUF397)